MYATVSDIETRCARTLTDEEKTRCATLLEDAAVIIDSFGAAASDEAKRLVSCNMIIRMLGGEDTASIPIGATQGTMSALGYSQTWNLGSGTSGELYLTRLDKKLLGTGRNIAFVSPLEGMDD